MAHKTHYPTFNVMEEQDAWDDHTQAVIQSRLEVRHVVKFLSKEETAVVETIVSHLTGDNRKEIIDYIVSHIDSMLQQNTGESQRKYGVVPAKELVRKGLPALEHSVLNMYGKRYTDLDTSMQQTVLVQLSQGSLEQASFWVNIPQKPLFQKLLDWTVEAYCSHPLIWSEIGYAGPAYPRGYMRTQLGQLEPWEAHAQHE